MRKKLLALPLCFVLLVIPLVTLQVHESSSEPSYYVDGCWLEPLDNPETYIPPIPISNGTRGSEILSMSVSKMAAGSAENAPIQVNCLLAFDEKYLCYYYHTPNITLNGVFYAELQLQRASRYLEEMFGVGLVPVAITSWRRTESGAVYALNEVIEKTGYVKNMWLNGRKIEALVAWTFDKLEYKDLSGVSEVYGLARNATANGDRVDALIMRYVAYWSDDNVLEHEILHLFNADDNMEGTYCYRTDCIMSYRFVSVTTWTEDGETFQVNDYTRVGRLYNYCCRDCCQIVNAWKWMYLGDEPSDPPGFPHGDC